FLGWEYSNEFFIVGLTTEAIVFTISAFEFKAVEEERKVYEWEKVFPELDDDNKSNASRMSLSRMGEVNEASTEALAKSIEVFDAATKRLNATTEGLAASVESIKNQVAATEKTSVAYATEMTSLKESIDKAALGASVESFGNAIKRLNSSTDGLAV